MIDAAIVGLGWIGTAAKLGVKRRPPLAGMPITAADFESGAAAVDHIA